jgi:hypothetical protein
MTTIYLMGAMAIALIIGCAVIVISLRSERDAAYEKGRQAGRAELTNALNAQDTKLRNAADIIQTHTDARGAQLIPLQKTLEDDVHVVANANTGRADDLYLDRSVVRSLNTIGDSASSIAKPS